MAKDIDIALAETLAGQGLTMEQIAYCLGVGTSTLYKHKKDKVEIQEAIKRGRAKGIEIVSNALFESAKGGNVVAQIFYLKNRSPEDWRDRRELAVEGEVKHTHTRAELEARLVALGVDPDQVRSGRSIN